MGNCRIGEFQCTIRVGEPLSYPRATQHRDPLRSSPVSTPPWLTAVRAAESKKASDIRVLDLREVTSFADFFVVCTGSNPKQIQAITEEIGPQMEERGEYPVSVEGFDNAEWVLADYGDYLIHVFSAKARVLLRPGAIVAARQDRRRSQPTPDPASLRIHHPSGRVDFPRQRSA